MSYPDGSPGRHAASATLNASRARTEPSRTTGPRFPRTRRVLAPEIRAGISERFSKQEFCQFCGGLHSGISTPACPRIATFELNADGVLVSAAYWQDGDWDTSAVFFSTDADEEEPASEPASR